jgi:hypothetical protein
LHGDLGEQFRRRARIGIDKHKPMAARSGGASIAGAGDLIDRFKDDARAGRSRQDGGGVS